MTLIRTLNTIGYNFSVTWNEKKNFQNTTTKLKISLHMMNFNLCHSQFPTWNWWNIPLIKLFCEGDQSHGNGFCVEIWCISLGIWQFELFCKAKNKTIFCIFFPLLHFEWTIYHHMFLQLRQIRKSTLNKTKNAFFHGK